MASRHHVSVYVGENMSLHGETDSARPAACSISRAALSSVALAESIKAAEGGAHPSLCIYQAAPHDDCFPAVQIHPPKSQVLQSHEAMMSFGCKIPPCCRVEAQECHFLTKKKNSTRLLQ